jgi:hypothetical protein
MKKLTDRQKKYLAGIKDSYKTLELDFPLDEDKLSQLSGAHLCRIAIGLRSKIAKRVIPDFSAMEVRTFTYFSTLEDGEPCSHTGCIAHVSHPCELCGRTQARGPVKIKDN